MLCGARFSVLVLCFLGVARATSTHARVSPVQKIIEMLGEMKAKTASDLAADQTSFSEFTQYCSDGTREKKQGIKTATRNLDDLEAKIVEASANVETYEAEIADSSSLISDKEKELAEAEKLREHEHADFKVTEAELLETLRRVSSAYDALKKDGVGGASFLQSGGSSKLSKQQLDGFQKVIESALFTGEQRNSLAQFAKLAPSQPSDDADSDFDIQEQRLKDRSASLLQSRKPEGVLDTIGELRDQAEKQLSDCRTAESESAHAFAMFKQGLENEIKNQKQSLAESQSNMAAATEASANASGEKEAIQKTKAGDEEFLKDLTKECQTKAQEFEERQQSGHGELEAIDKATEILQGGVKASFIQLKARVHRASSTLTSRAGVRAHSRAGRRILRDPFDDDSDESSSGSDEFKVASTRMKLVSKLRELSQTNQNFMLVQLAHRAEADPFVKIRGLIEDMIEKLMTEGAEEAEKKAFCDAELGKSTAAKKTKSGKLLKISARLDEAESAKASLQSSMKELEGELAQIDRLQKEATQIRSEEHTEFLKAQSDYKSSTDACAKAAAVLKEYYEGASFLQVSMATRRRSDDEEVAAQSGPEAGGQIVEFLLMAEEDFAKLLAEVESAEATASEEFEKLSQENKLGKATKEMEIKGKASEVKSLSRALNTNAEDKSSLEKEIGAVNAYLDKLKPQCETKSDSPEEKVAAREAEVAGLKDALSILDGSGV